MSETHSYEQLQKDPTLLKKDLFSDNPAEAMVARIASIGTHNSQLHKKYKLTDDVINKYNKSANTNPQKTPKTTQITKTIKEIKNTTNQEDEDIELDEENGLEDDIQKNDNYDDGDQEIQIDEDEETDSNNQPSPAEKSPGRTITVKSNGNIQVQPESSQNAQTVTDKKEEPQRAELPEGSEDDELELTIDDNLDEQALQNKLNNLTQQSEEITETYVKTIVDNLDESKTMNSDELEDDEKEEEQQKKYSWGIPKALRLLSQLDTLYRDSSKSTSQNFARFPDFLTLVRQCIWHASILTMGHPTFQKKIGSLLKTFLNLRKTEWERNAYGIHNSNDTIYLSELTLNKIELLNAYEEEVKKLFDEKERGFDTLKQIARTGFASAANTLTFGIYGLAKRREKKDKYSRHLEDEPKTKYERQIEKLENDIDSMHDKVDNLEENSKVRKWFYEKKLAKQEKKMENTSVEELNNQVENLNETIKNSSGLKKLYYKSKRSVKQRQLNVATIETRVADDLRTAYGQERDSFDNIISNSDDPEIVAQSIADSKNAEKSVNSRVQKHAAPEKHEHLAMALHLLVSTIRDDNNTNPFYTTSNDADQISALCQAYIEPYYEESSSSSSNDTFDKFELKTTNESNKLLQRMLAVIMAYDDQNLLNAPGILAVFNGDDPDIFDVNKGSKIWEKNSFKFNNSSFNDLITNCKRINSKDPKDRCYESYNTIFENHVFNQEFKNGLDNATSKGILKCFCGTTDTEVQKKIYNLLIQPEFSFKNIKPLLDKVYAPKSQNNKKESEQ